MSDEARDRAELSPLKRAYLALEELEAKLAVLERARREPIAIVGIGCRFPGGADTPEAFWELLAGGVDAVTEVPRDRYDVDAYYDPDPDAPGKLSTRYGAFLDRVDLFDPQFFGISPREAARMDPQQRILLEVGWEALEEAGLAPDRLSGSRTGVFVGIVNSDYGQLQLDAGGLEGIDAYYGAGSAHSIASGRLSYVLGLQGPSISVDTACSASLVAVHLACRSLRGGESDLALAGGVNVILNPETTIALSKLRMMAPDGRCKAFAANADGFVRGEGCGVVVLRRLSDALARGDRIHAVIRGTAVNQDGPTSGLTAPNGPAQEAVVREALADGGVAPADVTFVEAHGTGTSLGDPIEVQALAAVLGAGRDRSRPVAIGSVKTNVGHLESAAGIVGLIKAALALEHREIPPHLHFREPNPHVRWADLPVVVPTRPMPWPQGAPPLAGVSSFGFSGTNAHVVLEAAPEREPVGASAERPLHLLTLSARSEAALAELAGRVAAHLEAPPGERFADVCFTANAGRARLPQRLAVVAATAGEAREALAAFREGGEPGPDAAAGAVEAPDPPRVAFLFTGQGSQHAGMGGGLYETQPTFCAALDRCDELLRERLSGSLLDVLYPGTGTPSPIGETGWSQPALFVLEHALAELLASWGIRPSAVLGHSVGEYAAACAAGVLSFEDALGLVAERGRLMQELPAGGAMAAVFAAEERVAEVLARNGGGAVIACVNGPESVVVSGAETAVGAALEELAADGVKGKRLAVSHAFHSPLVEPMLDAFALAAREASFAAPRVRFVSSVTGELARGATAADPAYWVEQIRRPVRFAAAVETLAGLGVDAFVEIGPSPALLALGRRCLPGGEGIWLPTLREGHDDWRGLLRTVAALHVRGVEVDWESFDQDYPRRRVRLPSTPFERRRYWIEGARRRPRGAVEEAHPLLGGRLRSALPETQFETELTAGSAPFLADHRVHGVPIVPLAAYLELALGAGARGLGEAVAVSDLVLREPLALAEEPRPVQTIVRREGDGAAVEVLSLGDEGGWRLHATARVEAAAPGSGGEGPSLRELEARLAGEVSGEAHYAELAARGLDFGPSLHGVRRLRVGDAEALASVCLPDAAGAGRYELHPALLDACLQAFAPILPTGGELHLPVGVERFRLHAPLPVEVLAHATVRAEGAGVTGDLRVLDVAGRLVAELSGLRLRPASPEAVRRALGAGVDGWLYEVAWRPQPAAEGPLLAPAALAARVGARAADLAAEHGLERRAELLAGLDSVSGRLTLGALAELGWEPRPGERVETGALAERLGVAGRHRRLFGRLLALLAEDGVLARDGDGWEVVGVPEAGSPEEALSALRRRFPEARAQLDLVERCGCGLAEALAGRVDPLELLFSGGSASEVEELYQASAEARVYNAVAREALAAVVEALPPPCRIRIVEIGAGTGATTAAVLPVLPADRTEYLFTDVSPAFLAGAVEKFSEFPFLSTALFDAERDPEEQGLTIGEADVVLAVNVLHATADLRESLAHARRLLAPGGFLLVFEATAPERWIDVTFGLTDGWWRFRDEDVRAGYPLVPRARWPGLLTEAGFEGAVVATPETRGSAQALVAGRAPVGDRLEPVRDGWLVLADGRVGERLAELLAERGARAVVATAGDRFEEVAPDRFRLDPASPEHFRELLAALDERPLRAAVHLWSLEAPAQETGSLVAAEALSLGSALHLVQALAGWEDPESPRLVLVTRGAQPAGRTVSAPAQATLWGLAKAIDLEHPELRCLRVDLDPEADGAAEALLAELERAGAETEIALRGGVRYAARLVRARPGPAAGADPVRLESPGTGVLDDLALVPAERRAPGPGEVEIRVRATGLNFRDVLNALAVRSDPEPLGSECGGVVATVGEGVEGLEVGDQVMAVAGGSFATHVTTAAALVARKPRGLSFADAATFPMAYLTAVYALERLAGLRAGERVLVHAAAGGVGLAAVRLAQLAGAEVFATAGSPAKRAFLETRGVRHVLDSRSLAFADEVLALTDGEGIDVVLNSLAGEFVPASLACLAEGGRFLELGKRDLLSQREAAALAPGATYIPVDLGAHLIEGSPLARELFRDLVSRIETGILEPLPVTAFPLGAVADAFRHMAQARHVGKVVVTQEERIELGRPDGSYLVTGGLAGLGLLVARRLVERGARSVVLMGRGEPSEEARAAIRELDEVGARVTAVRGDVARAEDVARALAALDGMPPLRGVLHAAGVLDDGVLANQDWGRFERVLAPKVDGAWNLHAATRGLDLDYFCLFSSASSLFGSAGQGNHAAANAFLDALAHHRRGLGLPGLAVNWGAWAEVGAAAERGVGERVAARGVGEIPLREGLDALERALALGAPQVGVLPVDWGRYLPGRGRVPPFLAEVAREARLLEGPRRDEGPRRSHVLERLQGAPPDRRRELLVAFVAERAARVLGLGAAEQLPERRPLQEAGFDSLMAVELRNLLGAELGLGRALPATLVFDYPTAEAIAGYLFDEVLGFEADGKAAAAEASRGPGEAGRIAQAIGGLSDEEVDRLLAERAREQVAE